MLMLLSVVFVGLAVFLIYKFKRYVGTPFCYSQKICWNETKWNNAAGFPTNWFKISGKDGKEWIGEALFKEGKQRWIQGIHYKYKYQSHTLRWWTYDFTGPLKLGNVTYTFWINCSSHYQWSQFMELCWTELPLKDNNQYCNFKGISIFAVFLPLFRSCRKILFIINQ